MIAASLTCRVVSSKWGLPVVFFQRAFYPLLIHKDLVWLAAPEEMKVRMLWSVLTSEEHAEQNRIRLLTPALTLTAAGM
ncbi:hypothetical protein ILYODFUR_002529 [Ilyodon furcidens]|uniref:Uncharacterized protein n=1 Tax=Ilyodon furcidens TaxID=33524 RepID=A0ABV0U246_9TELE